MNTWSAFNDFSLDQKINTLFTKGTFVVSIRYYQYKVNLYQLGKDYIEVFINHKKSCIEKIDRLDATHSRMNFYCDQIKLNSLKVN